MLLLLLLACGPKAAPTPVEGVTTWRVHSVSQVDRMDVTVHEVAEVTRKVDVIEGGTRMVHSAVIVQRQAQTSYGLVDTKDLAEMPTRVELTLIHGADGTVRSSGTGSDTAALVASLQQQIALDSVPDQATWERSFTTTVPVKNKDLALPVTFVVTAHGERLDSPGWRGKPAERYRVRASVELTAPMESTFSKGLFAGVTDGTGLIWVDPADRMPLASTVSMRGVVVAGADDESPTTTWVHQHAERR